MKKIILICILMLNLFPFLKNGELKINYSVQVSAQDPYGDEDGDDDECPEGTWMNDCGECWSDFGICNKLDEPDEPTDCNGDIGGSAYNSDCGCIGGNTGYYDCPPDEDEDCNGDPGGSAYQDDCGCVGGNTGITECPTEPIPPDCAGLVGGSATVDACGTCVGGSSGLTAKVWYKDDDNDTWGNSSNTRLCYNNPGGNWVIRGGDFDDNCYNPLNLPDQCKNPCAQAKKTNDKMSSTTLSNQHTSIQSQTATTSKEYGAEQNMTSFPPGTPPGFKNVPARTDNATNSFAPNFTWNAIDGYTVGVSHGHPADGAPSPADLVNAYSNLTHPDLVAGGQAAIDYYKANF